MATMTNLKLPAQSQPVIRYGPAGQGYLDGGGVEAAQSVCDGLTGLAQQMCYAVVYGVNM
jgi:hypothetical protein